MKNREKYYCFIGNDKDIYEIPIIFLDIDGVLQPYNSKNRFDVDRIQLRKDISIEFNDDYYLYIDEYDVAAVYLDWHKKALENIKTLIKKTNARIILSTGWRDYSSYERMLKLFHLHDLDKYIIGRTYSTSMFRGSDYDIYSALHNLSENDIKEYIDFVNLSLSYDNDELNKQFNMLKNKINITEEQTVKLLEIISLRRNYVPFDDIKKVIMEKYPDVKKDSHFREDEILYYLYKHPIKNYVVIDDVKMYSSYLVDRSVNTYDYFKNDDLSKAISILS